MNKILYISLFGALSTSIVGCVGSSDHNDASSNSAQSLKTGSLNHLRTSPLSTFGDIQAEEVKANRLKLGTTSNQYFDLTFPESVVLSYTTGASGSQVWFQQYQPGTVYIDKKPDSKLCSAHFDSVYNNQYDIIFDDSMNCDNNDDSCEIPYYVAGHGEIKQTSYEANINYHYSVALDGKDCNNGVSPMIPDTLKVNIYKQHDKDFHAVFEVDTDKNVMPINHVQDTTPALSVDLKGGESVLLYGLGATNMKHITLDEKMTHDYAGGFPFNQCQNDKFKHTDATYSLSPELDRRCEAISGKGAKNIGVMFTNSFLKSTMSVDTEILGDFKSNIKFLNSEESKTTILLPGQARRIDLCLNEAAWSGTINHSFETLHIGHSLVQPGFLGKKPFATYHVTHHFGEQDYKEELTLSRDGKVFKNGKQVSSLVGNEGMCALPTIGTMSVDYALTDLETKLFLDLEADIKVISKVPNEHIANASNYLRPIRVQNIGMAKSIDIPIYASNVEYSIIDKDRVKSKSSVWGLYNPVIQNADATTSTLQFDTLDIAKKWDSGEVSALNLFISCNEGFKCDGSNAVDKGGFLTFKFKDVDGKQKSQTFPFYVSYGNMFLANSYEYNIFTGMPIIRDAYGNVTKQKSGDIALGIFPSVANGNPFIYPYLEAHKISESGGFWNLNEFSGKDVNRVFKEYVSNYGYSGSSTWESSFGHRTFEPYAHYTWDLAGWEDYFSHLYAGGYASDKVEHARYFEIPTRNLDTGALKSDKVSMTRSAPQSKLIVETTATGAAMDIFTRNKSTPYSRLTTEFVQRSPFLEHVQLGTVVKDFRFADRYNQDKVYIDDYGSKVIFPIDIELLDNSQVQPREQLVAKLNCSILLPQSCEWKNKPELTTIATPNGTILVTYSLVKDADGQFRVKILYDAAVSPEPNKFIYLIDNIKYQMMKNVDEDMFTLYFPKAYSKGLGYGSEAIWFNANEEFNGSMKKDLTTNIFSIINNSYYRPNVCDWNSNQATLSCQIAIAPDYFQAQNKAGQLHEEISNNVTMTLKFVIPSPNGEWMTKTLSPKDIKYLTIDSEPTTDQIVMGGSNSGFTGVLVHELNSKHKK
ncbi:MAG: hypothetical protein K2Q03_00565 [Sphingobacteriaceae bacterium]|nr:hypothetical protein [Sphingobacteriaceae bacterium]